MRELLLCSSDPILIKGIYGVLRDEGYGVEVVDHPSLAVQMTFKHEYAAVIIDSEHAGLSAEEAAQIIKNLYPYIPVIIAGDVRYSPDAVTIEKPIDIEDVKRLIHDINNPKQEERNL